MGETETTQVSKERTVTLTDRQAVVDKYYLAGLTDVLHFITSKIEEELGKKPKDDGRNSAEPDA